MQRMDGGIQTLEIGEVDANWELIRDKVSRTKVRQTQAPAGPWGWDAKVAGPLLAHLEATDTLAQEARAKRLSHCQQETASGWM